LCSGGSLHQGTLFLIKQRPFLKCICVSCCAFVAHVRLLRLCSKCSFWAIPQLMNFLNLHYSSTLDPFVLFLSWMHMCLLCLYNTSVTCVLLLHLCSKCNFHVALVLFLCYSSTRDLPRLMLLLNCWPSYIAPSSLSAIIVVLISLLFIFSNNCWYCFLSFVHSQQQLLLLFSFFSSFLLTIDGPFSLFLFILSSYFYSPLIHL
jgi:hypothetical protein